MIFEQSWFRRLKQMVGLLIAVLMLGMINVIGQGASEETQKPISDDCSSLRNYFVDSLVRANRTGGIAFSNEECVNIADSEAPVKTFDERLSLILLRNPSFRSENNSGSINLFSANTSPELLDTEIQSFTYHVSNPFSIAVGQLLSTREVRATIERAKLSEGMRFGGLQSPPRQHPNIEVRFEKTTVKQILNAIARIQGWGVWVYRENHSVSTGKTFSLEFVVR